MLDLIKPSNATSGASTLGPFMVLPFCSIFSLIPLIKGESFEEKFAFSETGNPLMDSKPPKIPNTKSIRTSKWKLILNEYDQSQEFYDLENDPNEEENLIGKNTELEIEFMKELSRHLKISSD